MTAPSLTLEELVAKFGLRTEYRPVAALPDAPRNPKQHALEAVKDSIRRWGFVEHVLLDGRTQRLIAGHGRKQALLEMRGAGTPVPAHIVPGPDGEWYLPVTIGWSSKNDREAEALLVALNALPPAGGWNNQMLAELLADLVKSGEGALVGVGFDNKALDALLKELKPKTGRTGADDRPEIPANPYVKLGELWALGDHLIICGDCTDAGVVDRLFQAGGVEPNLMTTDPPYGVKYDPNWRNKVFGQGNRAIGEVKNDDQVDWFSAWKLFPGAVSYVWHAGHFAGPVQASLEAADFDIRAQLIWVKPHFVVGRGHYHFRHEPCWYAVRRGQTADWHGGRDQASVWEMRPAGGVVGSGEEADERTGHSTQKPVEAFRRPLMNHTRPGESFYEPFSGSGTAIIAGEELNRRCFAVELNPAYVQVAIERWQRFTGKQAERVAA